MKELKIKKMNKFQKKSYCNYKANYLTSNLSDFNNDANKLRLI